MKNSCIYIPCSSVLCEFIMAFQWVFALLLIVGYQKCSFEATAAVSSNVSKVDNLVDF